MAATDVTRVLQDRSITVSDRFYLRRIAWPTSLDTPPLLAADVAQLNLPAISGATPLWPIVIADLDAAFAVEITGVVLDAQVSEARTKGSRDFSCQIADDAMGSLQNLITFNDVITWTVTIANALDPSIPETTLTLGHYLVDGTPEAITNAPGMLTVNGRDSVKLLMLDNFIGVFDIDRIKETQNANTTYSNATNKVQLSLIKSVSDGERLIYVHDHDENANPIPPTYNWSKSPQPKFFHRKPSTNTFTEIAQKDGVWTVLLGDGQVWINRQWFDDKLGWANGKTANSGTPPGVDDPLINGINPNQEIWAEFSRNVLPEDSLLFTVATLSVGGGYLTVSETISTALAAKLAKYAGVCHMVFQNGVAAGKRILLTHFDAPSGQFSVSARDIRTGDPVGLDALGVVAGNTFLLGEVNRPETRIEEVLKAAGFHTYRNTDGSLDPTKPFAIEAIEPILATYLWDDVSQWDGVTAADSTTDATRNITPTVNADVSYPQNFSIADATPLYFAGLRRILAVYCDVRGVGTEDRTKYVFEYYNGTTWVALTPTSDGTAGFTKPGHIVFDTFVMANSAVVATSDKAGLYRYTDQTYTDRFLVRLRRTVGLGGATPVTFAMLRPSGPVQMATANFRVDDQVKFWDVLEKTIRPFVPPNYDWADPGDLNFSSRYLVEADTPAYTIDTIQTLERESDDTELYTEVTALGRRRDEVNVILSQSAKKTVVYIPYVSKGWDTGLSAYTQKSHQETAHAYNYYMGTQVYNDHPDLCDPLWAGDGTTIATIGASTHTFEWDTGKVRPRWPALNLQDNDETTIAGDQHFHGTWGNTTDHRHKGAVDTPANFSDDNPIYDEQWVLCVAFRDTTGAITSRDIGQIYVTAGPLKELFAGGSNSWINTQQVYELWKSATTDDESEYELMVPAFILNPKDTASISSDQFVSSNTTCRYIRLKVRAAAKSLNRPKVGAGGHNLNQFFAQWQIANLRMYEDEVIHQTARLGVDNLANNYDSADLTRDAKWARRLRRRTLVLPFVNEYANSDADVLAEAIAWLRESFRKFLTLKVTGCRPDVQIGDTVEVDHVLTEETTVWSVMPETTDAESAAKAAAREGFLASTKTFLVEEVTRGKGGMTTIKMTAYKASV